MSEREPTRRAVVLRYDQEADGAPRVVATGAGEIAKRILALAEEAGLPVREDPALAEAIGRLQLEQEIPHELFVAVAEVLVWAYGLERRTP